jgi:NADPH2:quinone reductase
MTTAIRVHAYGGPEQLRLEQIEVPDPGPGELLVEVGAAGVNFIDIYQRRGQYPLPLPLVLGGEGAGRVVAVGKQVTRFSPGDRVAWTMASSSYAERVLIPERCAVGVPDGIDTPTAAAVMTQGITAEFLTHAIVQLKPGDVAVVQAGAGGLGLMLTQMLVREGVRVISTVSTEAKATVSRQAGAEPIIGYDAVARKVRDATGGRGAQVVYDGVGADTFDASLDAAAVRGTVVLVGAASGPVKPLDPQVLNRKGSLLLTRPSIVHFIGDRAEFEQRAAAVFDLVASGELQVRIHAEFPLADAAEAHRALEGRASTGKILLIP